MYLLIVWLGVLVFGVIMCAGSTSMCYAAARFLFALRNTLKSKQNRYFIFSMLPKYSKSTEEACEIMSKQRLRTYTGIWMRLFYWGKIQNLQR